MSEADAAEIIRRLTAERDDADRRAGAAERTLAQEREASRARADWLSKAKQQWGVADAVSFDAVWDEALALKRAAAGEMVTFAGETPKVTAYRVGEGPHQVAIECVSQRKGPDLWAVRWQGNCLGLEGWEVEPTGSSRTSEFLARCRYGSAQEALQTLSDYGWRGQGEISTQHGELRAADK